jgi:hypothetical protein
LLLPYGAPEAGLTTIPYKLYHTAVRPSVDLQNHLRDAIAFITYRADLHCSGKEALMTTPPSVLYHGSATPGLTVLEPRHRFTPRAEDDQSPDGVYASDDGGFAAGHAFPWQSADGIDLGYVGDDAGVTLTLHVPVTLRYRLDQPVVVYTVPAAPFTLLTHVSPSGRTFRALVPVAVLAEQRFASVWEAFTSYGGEIVITR